MCVYAYMEYIRTDTHQFMANELWYSDIFRTETLHVYVITQAHTRARTHPHTHTHTRTHTGATNGIPTHLTLRHVYITTHTLMHTHTHTHTNTGAINAVFQYTPRGSTTMILRHTSCIGFAWVYSNSRTRMHTHTHTYTHRCKKCGILVYPARRHYMRLWASISMTQQTPLPHPPQRRTRGGVGGVQRQGRWKRYWRTGNG